MKPQASQTRIESHGATPLPAEIARVLAEFALRRRRMLLVRSWAACITIVALGLMLAALLDRFVVLPDAWRVGVSATVYVVGLIVLLWHGLIPAWQRLPPAALAASAQQLDPQGCAGLVSAVELSRRPALPGSDSQTFREMAQAQVAHQLRDWSVRRALPWRRARRPMLIVLGVAIVLGVLLSIPSLRFGLLLRRAAAPWANLQRVSSLQITLLKPAPQEGFVPEGEPVRVEVELSDERTSPVTLQMRGADGRTSEVRLVPTAPRRWATDLTVTRESLVYRVQAGDAMTRRYTLVPRPRPAVLGFQKTYEFPAYTQLSPRVTKDETGELEALEGSRARVELQVDQPLQGAALVVQESQGTHEIAMQGAAEGRVQATVEMLRPARYFVRLIAQETGFDNRFRPTYAIRILPDAPPNVTLQQPGQDQVQPPDATVLVQGNASDDLRVTRFWPQIRINGSAWRDEMPVTSAGSASVSLERRLDLYGMHLSAGDQLSIRLAATDSKGQLSLSAERRIVVNVPGFDPKVWQRVQAQKQALQSLQAAQRASQQAQQQTQLAQRAAGDPQAHPTVTQQALAAASNARKQAEQALERAVEQTAEVLRDSAPTEQDALVDMGRWISRVRRQEDASSNQALDAAARDMNSPQAAASLQNAVEKSNAAQESIAKLQQAMARLVAVSQAQAVAEDLQQLHKQQRELVSALNSNPSEGDKSQQLMQQEALVVSQTRAAENRLAELSQMTTAPLTGQFEQVRANLEKPRSVVEQVSNQAAPSKRSHASVQLRNALDQAGNQLKSLAEQARNEQNEIARLAQQEAGSLSEELGRLSGKDAPTRTAETEQLARGANDLARLEESRATPAVDRAADADRLARALRSGVNEKSDNAVALQQAVRTLEQAEAKRRAGESMQEMQPQVAEARSTLRELAPALPAQMENLAQQARQLSDRSAATSAQGLNDRGQPAAIDPVLIGALREEQQRVSDKVEQVRQSLRREAGEQDPLSPTGRRLAREADVADARLKQADQQAQARMEQAVRVPAQRQSALRSASNEQARLADQLSEAARRLQSDVETADASSTRDAQADKDLGLDGSLQAEHQRVEALAQAAQGDAQKQRELLERELASDPQMRRALAEKAQEATGAAASKLQQAAKDQKNLAEQTQTVAQQQTNAQAQMQQRVRGLAEQVATLANKEIPSQVPDSVKEAGASLPQAQQQARRAAEQMNAGQPKPEEMQQRVAGAEAPLRETSKQLENAAKAAQKAAESHRQREQSASRDLARAQSAVSEAQRALDEAQQRVAQAVDETSRKQASQDRDAAQQALHEARSFAQEIQSAQQAAAQNVRSAQSTQQQLQQASARAGQLAKDAKNLAGEMAREQNAQMEQSQRLARNQQAVQQRVREAADDLGRAESHRQRLESNEATSTTPTSGSSDTSRVLSEASQKTRALTEGAMQQAQHQMTQGAPTSAVSPAQEAQRQLEAQASAVRKLAETGAGEAMSSAVRSAPTGQDADTNPRSQPSSAKESAALAEALDRLAAAGQQAANQASASPQSTPESAQSSGDSNATTSHAQAQAAAAAALAEAARQRAMAHQQARVSGRLPGQSPSSPVSATSEASSPSITGVASGAGEAPLITAAPASNIGNDNWAKLAPAVAKQLLEAQRDQVPTEYRGMVEQYFRAVAEKSAGSGGGR